MKNLPERYISHFSAIDVTIPELGTIATSVGPRGRLGRRWRCRRCGKEIKPNTAGAQSHIAKHLRTGA